MRIILSITTMFLTLTTFGQGYTKKDIVGQWKVTKSDLYLDNNLVRTTYLSDYSVKTDTIVEGLDMGSLNENFTKTVKSFLGSTLIFNESDSSSWIVGIKELGYLNKYWVLTNNSNEIKICNWKDKDKLTPLYTSFRIKRIEDNKFIFSSSESEAELRFTVSKIE